MFPEDPFYLIVFDYRLAETTGVGFSRVPFVCYLCHATFGTLRLDLRRVGRAIITDPTYCFKFICNSIVESFVARPKLAAVHLSYCYIRSVIGTWAFVFLGKPPRNRENCLAMRIADSDTTKTFEGSFTFIRCQLSYGLLPEKTGTRSQRTPHQVLPQGLPSKNVLLQSKFS